MFENSSEINPQNTFNSQEIYHDLWEKEVDGAYKAMQFVQLKARNQHLSGLDRYDIFEIHKLVINDPFNPEKNGVLRNVRVAVGCRVNGELRTAAFEPEDPHFLSEIYNEFASELEDKTKLLSVSSPVDEVIETATWAHHQFIKIHPFEDGNGRTARLIVDYIFKKSRLPYIRDWGAKGDEYHDFVDRSYRQEGTDILKLFLAKKLSSRLDELINNNKYIKNLEVEDYLKLRKLQTNSLISKLNPDIIKTANS